MPSLVVGGTSGLGLELAKALRASGDGVEVLGRFASRTVITPGSLDAPEMAGALDMLGLGFVEFDLTAPALPGRVVDLVGRLSEISTLVYAAGYRQDGRVTDLGEGQIENMLDVCGRGLIYFVRAILERQGGLAELITVTSTSQWTPHREEPVYCFAKAGAAHFSNAMAEDGRVGKVLVVGPSGMRTPFWAKSARDDFDSMLDPVWVAGQMMELREGEYRYRFAKILRGPARVEVVETR